jgi:hypothetical protein
MKTLQRSSFGDWGKNLDDYKFACTIASLGICGSLHSVWPVNCDAKSNSDYIRSRAGFSEPLPLKFFMERPEEWEKYTTVTSPDMLVELWELLKDVLPGNPRFLLEFDDITVEDYPGIKWLMGQVETAMGNGRLPVFYMPLKRSAGPIRWKWPIRTGFFTDLKSKQLTDKLRDISSTIDWMGNLTRIIELDDQSEESIDILFIPGGIKNALDSIVHGGKAIHANSVCIINTSVDNEQNHWKYINNILQLTQASALFEVTTDNFKAWTSSFFMELSHDKPFDLALAKSQVLPGSRVMLWSVPEFITASSILKYCSDLLDNPLLRSRFGGTINVPPNISNKLGLSAGPHSIDEIKHSIMDIGWLHEVGGASITVAVELLLRELQAKPQQFITYMAPPPPRLLSRMSKAKSASSARTIMHEEMKLEKREEDQRYLQAGVSVRNQDIGKAFWRKQVNKISIHVGPTEEGNIRSEEVFRDDLLPETKADGHMLSVTFFEPDLMDQPEVAGLYLPKKGKSKPCVFNLFVPEKAIKVEARIIVQYKNRILQNSILRGPAADYFHGDPYFSESKTETKTGSSTEISIVSTFQVSQAIQDLEKRSRFDGAFLLNHNGETPGMYGINGHESLYVRLDDAAIKDHVQKVEDILDKCDWDIEEYNGLTSTGTTSLLRDLAFAGSYLYKGVIRRLNPAFPGNTAPLNGVPQKIQVVSANVGSRMPFEFIYDFTAPDDNAGICPNAPKVLEDGKCETCPYKNESPASVICPMGFWCMSRVIEWHAFTEELSESTKNAPFLLKKGTGDFQGQLKLLKDPLVGTSNKVTKAMPSSISDLRTSFEKAKTSKPIFVNSWKAWRDNLTTLEPTIEVLLVHTIKDDKKTMLELGNKTISALNLDGLIPDKNDRPAIVLLLGCSTGTSQIQFQSVAAMVEACQAAIIVSTTAEVFSPIATRLACHFIEQLGELKSGQSFGDAMLAIRRKSLADGIPMVLCLRTYGDADWQLVK